MFRFDVPYNETTITDYKNGADQEIFFVDFVDLRSKMSAVIDSLLSKADFQDVIFIYQPHYSAPERVALRVLLELDPDFDKVTRFIHDRSQVPHLAYFVNEKFDLVEFNVDEFLLAIEPDFANGDMETLAS